jgi:hypothetical protein
MSLSSILQSQIYKNGLSNQNITTNHININYLLKMNIIEADVLNYIATNIYENYNPINNENFIIINNNNIIFQKKINDVIYNQNEGYYLFNQNSDINIRNKIFKCDNTGKLIETGTFFDKNSTPKKLYINHILQELTEGTIFLTYEDKIYIQINNNLKSIKIYDL